MLPADEDRLNMWLTRRSSALRFLEWLALKLEWPISRLTGQSKFNPFYYTGPLASFLLLIVMLTGLYLMLFYQFGFEAAYQSVAKIEGQVVARTVRAIHRYGSDAAVIVSLLHAFRIFFMGRFRGPRWLAWVSGVAMMVVLWLVGVSGYWLIWDQPAQLITISFTNLLRQVTPFGDSFAAFLFTAGRTDQSWIFMSILLLVHILLSALLGLFFWYHLLRLNRPTFLPDRHWLIGLGVVLLAVSIVAPVGLLPQANLSHLPGPVILDLLFLFFIPVTLNALSGWFWGGATVIVLAASVIPWLSFHRRQQLPRVVIDPARCTGCTHCAVDCPYKAITMAPRSDETSSKLVALAHPDLCVSCGICLGSCDGQAISMGSDLSTEMLWHAIQTRLAMAQSGASSDKLKVVFTCERHAAQGARPYLNQETAGQSEGDPKVVIIPLSCVGSAHPNLFSRTLEAGAAEVLVVGCPPDDCTQREGNLLAEERVTRKRLPRLKRAFREAPISTMWLPPDAFAQVLTAVPAPAVVASNPKDEPTRPGLSWRSFVPGLVLLGLVLILSVWLNNTPFQPYPGLADQAIIQVILPDPAKPFDFLAGRPTADQAGWPTRLKLEVDGRVLFEKLYDPANLFSNGEDSLFEELQIAPGEHLVCLCFQGEQKKSLILGVRKVTFTPGQILILGFDNTGPPVGER